MPNYRLTCAVGVCNNYYYKTKKILDGDYPITYHYFPRNLILCNRWIQACNRTDTFKPESSFICSIHFQPEDFVRMKREDLISQQSKRRLKYNVVPTRNLTLAEISSYILRNTHRKSHELIETKEKVKVLVDSPSDDEIIEDPVIENLNVKLNTSSEDELNLLRTKYDQLLNDYKEFKITSETEIIRLTGIIKEKDEEFTKKLRQIISHYLTDTEIDLVLFLRKQKHENA